ncbi:MAG: hypothetical protein ACRENK_05125 [Gemmatimonadaceae bacterium]
MRFVVSMLLLALVGTGCSDAIGPGSLNGKWAEDVGPESSWEVNLAVNGSSISGAGTWYGEACCGGDISVTGSVKGADVHLDFSSTNSVTPGSPLTSHFDGRLITPKELQGTITYDPPNQGSAQVTYTRT